MNGKDNRLDAKKEISVNEMVADTGRNKRSGDMEFFTPYDLHRRWGKAISLKTMANWRSLGLGRLFFLELRNSKKQRHQNSPHKQ